MQELITDGLKVKLKASQKILVDWYEENKDDFEDAVFRLIKYSLDLDIDDFFMRENNLITTLVNMHQFGYEIEQEPKYIVELPNPNRRNLEAGTFLTKKDGKLVIHSTSKEQVNKSTSYILTEAEIKADFDWAWQFAKKVEE